MPSLPADTLQDRNALIAEALKKQKRQWVARFAYDERSSRDPLAAHPDYVRDLFRRSYVRAVDESEGLPLDSATSWFVGSDAAFYMLRSKSCVEAKRTVADAEADGINGIVFDCVLAGVYTETTPTGSLALEPGDLALVQSTVQVVARSRFAHLSSVFVPRYRIVEVLGTDAAEDDFILRRLTASPLAPFAVSHMRLLADLYGKLAPADFDIALDATAALLLKMLGSELERSALSKGPPSAVFNRALAYIEQHHRNSTLSPEEIGHAVGVSRARLYKLFGHNKLTVSGYLRDLRLRRFVEALRVVDEASIGRLAWSCGFDMQAADFARLFKRTYGMTPRDALSALRQGHTVSPVATAERRES